MRPKGRFLSKMNESKLSRTVVITNEQGLHARPADLFVKLANRFDAAIEVVKENRRVDGKSILDILTLGAGQGSQLVIEAVGRDAQEALDALAALIDHNFAEDERAGEEQTS